MIIKNKDGSELDTATLSDDESEIAELAGKLHQLCSKYRKPMFLTVSNKKGPIMIWNFTEYSNQSFDETNNVFAKICKSIHHFLQTNSSGYVGTIANYQEYVKNYDH